MLSSLWACRDTTSYVILIRWPLSNHNLTYMWIVCMILAIHCNFYIHFSAICNIPHVSCSKHVHPDAEMQYIQIQTSKQFTLCTINRFVWHVKRVKWDDETNKASVEKRSDFLPEIRTNFVLNAFLFITTCELFNHRLLMWHRQSNRHNHCHHCILVRNIYMYIYIGYIVNYISYRNHLLFFVCTDNPGRYEIVRFKIWCSNTRRISNICYVFQCAFLC